MAHSIARSAGTLLPFHPGSPRSPYRGGTLGPSQRPEIQSLSCSFFSRLRALWPHLASKPSVVRSAHRLGAGGAGLLLSLGPSRSTDPMPYLVAEEIFPTKEAITARCRNILTATPDTTLVADDSVPFLMALFQYHNEWLEKSSGGVIGISTQTTIQGTRCFVLRRSIGDQIDISYVHAIRLLPNPRTAPLLPQALRDFRNAAREAINTQIYEFRDRELRRSLVCPYTNIIITRENCAVDHTPPQTFDRLLFDFCLNNQINPLTVRIGSQGGTVAVIEDQFILSSWQSHHRNLAQLRLISRIGNLQLPKVSHPWAQLWQ